MKKVYVAARFDNKESVREVYEKLQEIGYSVAYDWTEHTDLISRRNQAYMDLQGVGECDIFILLTAELMWGAFVELGVALALYKKVYAVGKPGARDNLFYSHPAVTRKDTIEEVLSELASR